MKRRSAHFGILEWTCALLVLLSVGCRDSPEETTSLGGVVIQIAREGRVDPGGRLGEASRVVYVDVDGSEKALGPQDRPASNATVTWTGRRVFLAARDGAEGQVSLWSASLPGGATERLPLDDHDCGSADELPDGRIVFSARTSEPAPTAELESAWALFVFDPSAESITRITWGLSEIDPAVLGDGRIIFAGWQPGGDGRPSEGAFGLFTVHPDGSGVAPYHGHHAGPRWKLLPRELSDGDVVYQAGDDPTDLRSWRIDRRKPAGEEVEVSTELPEGLERMDDASAFAFAASRPRPQGHLSMVDPTGDRGRIFGVDARPQASRDEARSLRVRARLIPGDERTLGTVELAEDGSYFLEVPANVGLWLDVLDHAGEVLEASTTPIWVRPGERRGCVGCHETPSTAPPNRRPRAVLGEPVDLMGELP